MPTVEELLNSPELYSEEEPQYCMLESDTSRVVVVPDRWRNLGVEGDNRAEKVPFKFPKIVGDNLDLTKMRVQVNFVNANDEPDIYLVNDVKATSDGNYVTFSWEIRETAMKAVGTIGFVVYAVQEVNGIQKRWFTTLNVDCQSLVGLFVSDQIVEQYPDIIQSLLQKMDSVEQIATPEAMQEYVNQYFEDNPVDVPGGIPSGGTTGQVLVKRTDKDYDAIWGTISGSGSGLTQTQVTSLYDIIKICAFTENPTAKIKAFETAWGIQSDIPEEIWTISNNLTNVSNSNNATYVAKGASYSAKITANEGCTLESVTVEMGGTDITDTSYSDGNINISSVTGNIVITALAIQTSQALPKDGLLDFFDFRNKEYKSGSGGLYYMNSDSGNGMLYSWTNQSGKVGDNIGLKGLGGSYTTKRATGYPVTNDFPHVRTLCMFGKGGVFIPTDLGVDSNLSNSFLYKPKYKTTDKSEKNMPQESVLYPEGFNETGYNACFCVVNGNTLKVYFDDKLNKTFDGSEIEDFASWDLSELKITSFANYATAFAIYDRELSEIEIVETLEYFKTLEVSE